jgi:hypothetical protein
MSSLRQIAANRRNALKSTGPVTAEGKDRSRCNAVRHGLTAETVIETLEDAADYQAFEAAVIADHDVETAVERELVLRLASVLWRLRRATGIETALFNAAADHPDKLEPRYSGPALIAGADLSKGDQSRMTTAQDSDGAMSGQTLDRKRNIGDVYLRLVAVPTFPLDRLSRYEYMLWRQARQIVLTLQSLRSHKRARHSRFPFPFGTTGR